MLRIEVVFLVAWLLARLLAPAKLCVAEIAYCELIDCHSRMARSSGWSGYDRTPFLIRMVPYLAKGPQDFSAADGERQIGRVY